MMSNLFRLGRDAEIRFTGNGDAVCSLSLAYDYGYGKNKSTQWIDASLWGNLAESLQPYLVKGKKLHAVIDDIHIQEYKRKDGSMGTKLAGKVIRINLADSQGKQDTYEEVKQEQETREPKTLKEMEDDIPF